MKRIRHWSRHGAVLVIFLVGLGLRLYDLNDAPLDFHPTRQLHSAMIARGMFYQTQVDLPAWEQAMAIRQWRSEGQIEPLVMEQLAAWSYQLAGGAYLWLPRLWAIAFWLGGSLLVYLLGRSLAGWVGGLATMGLFLFLPYAVTASRSFQPEALQVAAIAAALWAAFRWQALRASQPAGLAGARLTWLSPVDRWAILSGLLAGLAIYVKVTSAFFLGPVLVVLVLQNGRGKFGRLLRDRDTWIVLTLALAPAVLYHLDGFFVSGFLKNQAAGRFYPEMWLDVAFYLRWLRVLERLAPISLVLAGLLGNLLADDRRRPVLLAFWAGYGLYGLALPHHFSTHDYYHLVLLIPVSLGIGSIAGFVFAHLPAGKSLVRSLAATAVCAGLLVTVYNVRTDMKRNNYRAEASLWQEVGAWLGTQSQTVALVDDYGGGLKYWGWVMPLIWPTADDLRLQVENGSSQDFTERFEHAVDGRDFFLVSPISELERQPELAHALSRYRVVYQVSNPGTERTMRIYRLRAP